jgi:hypothetical protein
MNEFDDSVLRDQLQRLGGHGPDEDGAYLRMQQRVRIAKRRRAAAVIGGLGVTLVVGFAAASLRQPAASHLSPATGGGNDVFVTVSTVENTTDSTEPSSTEPQVSATEVSSPDATNVPNTTKNSSGNQGHGSTNSGHGGSTATNGTTSSTLQPPATTKPSSTLVSIPAATADTTSATSSGGKVVVKLDAGSISIASISAVQGYTYQIDKNEGDRIRVTFKLDGNGNGNSNGGTSHIEFTLENGKVVFSVVES